MMMFFRLPVSIPAFTMMMFFPFARFIAGSRFSPPVPPQHPSLWCPQLSCCSQSATKKYKQFNYKQKHNLLETRYGCPIIEAARNTTMTNPMALTSMLLIIYRTDNDCLFHSEQFKTFTGCWAGSISRSEVLSYLYLPSSFQPFLP